MAKSPVVGLSKTRLCPPCTLREAAALAEAALRDTLAAVLAAPVAGRRVIVLDGARGGWLPDGIEVIAQRGAGLAQRLAAAFEDVRGPAFVIGMDTPQVDPSLLARAAHELSDAPSVFGPADDGGYWGIGLRVANGAVFADVPMSTPDTGEVQLARLRGLGLRPATLPAMLDVDTFAAARVVAGQAPDGRFAACLAQVHAAMALRDADTR